MSIGGASSIDEIRGRAAAATRVLIIDDHEAFVRGLCCGLRQRNCTAWVAATFDEAAAASELCHPDIVVSELLVGQRSIFDVLLRASVRVPLRRWAVVTAYPSVATAVKLVRMGVAAYLAKPVSAATILAEFDDGSPVVPEAAPDTFDWPSLDRTIWEYLSQVYLSAGTMTEAARRLGVDRRSLRRMLSKHPPRR